MPGNGVGVCLYQLDLTCFAWDQGHLVGLIGNGDRGAIYPFVVLCSCGTAKTNFR